MAYVNRKFEQTDGWVEVARGAQSVSMRCSDGQGEYVIGAHGETVNPNTRGMRVGWDNEHLSLGDTEALYVNCVGNFVATGSSFLIASEL